MKKKISLFVVFALVLAVLAGCSVPQPSSASQPGGSSVLLPESGSALPEGSSSLPQTEPVTMHIAGLRGATTMGMVRLMADADEGLARHDYQVEVFGTADEIVPKLVNGEMDIAAIPANLASVVYQNTGAIQVAAINTLGVLYVVESGDTVQTVEDLRGKTIYSTGKGTTPEFALNYILTQNGIDPEKDVTIEFKSESTEIAAMMEGGKEAIAVLPQPYVTALQAQNETVRVALDLTEEWDKVSEDSGLVTGVLVVRKGFAEENPNAFADFLEDYKASIAWVNANVPEAAVLVADYGIVAQAPLAEKAIPKCNIVYIDGDEMQQVLGGYLAVLFEAKAEAVGGALPDNAFYHAG